MKMKKNRGIITLLVIAAITCGLLFTCIKGIGPTGTGSAKNIKLGLDLAGGVSITYQTVDKNPSDEDMADTVYKLQKRVENYSTEASVYQEGDNRISIEIPGVSDANSVLEDLGRPGSLYFVTSEDNSGNATFQYDATTSKYVLNYSQEELEANGAIVLYGTDIADAQAATQQDNLNNNQFVVKLEMTEEGKAKFAEATSANVGKQIAIVYDGEIISAPSVKSAITGGEAVIEGMSGAEEAEILASSIRIGGLSLELEELSSNIVGAQLGVTAIATSLKAALIGLVLVILLMCFLYRLPGVASSIALVIYTGMTLLFINAFNITLTLPGIAGVILAIGMAVDANVIIFARVREEIATGKSVAASLKSGFQKALSAIVDGNITTLIAAAVLYYKGSGSVKGFAETLAIGIVISMFTALVITRQIIYSFYAVGLQDEKYYGKAKQIKTIDFIGKRKIFLAISGVVILIGLGVMAMNAGNPDKGALNYSLEFKGGTSTTVEFGEDMTLEEIDAKVSPVVKDAVGEVPQVQKVAGSNEVVLKTSTLSLEQREKLYSALESEFGIDQNTIQASNISATVSNEMRQDAIIAVIIAVICMLIYIWFRFKDIRFATSSVLALSHDVLVVLGVYAVLRVSVGNTFIACMLTIVGYSINATIVIFDRIREKLKTGSVKNLEGLVNDAITQTLTRSVYTSLTTFIMVFVLFIMGVTTIREFALPLMAGIIAGGYSSVCITGALWYIMKKKKAK